MLLATLDDELTVQVGSGSSLVAIDETGVGIGTTANEVALRVDGEVYANLFTGDGSGLRNLSNDSKWGWNYNLLSYRTGRCWCWNNRTRCELLTHSGFTWNW